MNQQERDIINDNTVQCIAQMNALGMSARVTIDLYKGRCRFVKIEKAVIMEDGEQRLMLIPAQSYRKDREPIPGGK